MKLSGQVAIVTGGDSDLCFFACRTSRSCIRDWQSRT